MKQGISITERSKIDDVPYVMKIYRPFNRQKNKWIEDWVADRVSKDDVIIRVTGMDGYFRLTGAQQERIVKFLTEK